MNSMNIRTAATYIFSILFVLLAVACSGQAEDQQPATATVSQGPVNEAPVIINVISNPLQVAAGSTAEITCEANDANGDNLTYRWTATGGTISGSSSVITWTAPEKPGSFMVTATVSDGHGGTVKKDAIITVPKKPNNPPVIEGITFQRPGHMATTIKPNMTQKEKDKNPDPLIRIYETADITCLASDPDNDDLDYIWMATGGSIKGSGAYVQWVVPGAGGNYKVTCEVSDPDGLTSTFTIDVTVKCCGI